MATFQELYQTLLAAQARSNLPEAIKYIRTQQDFDPKQLDCLLNPQKHPLVWRTGECGCAPGEGACERACAFDAIHSAPEEGGRVAIDVTRCVGCSACIDACAAKKLEASRDAVAAMEAVRRHEGPVYALVAPAFMGQFSEAVTPGMLRSAFLRLGFDGMIEVALFADILTLKEALEFDKNITREGDFQLTSCCCPLWIAMIRKIYSELQSHLPASVSPMIACGRSVKALHPDALTIFVGPCIAKKAEAREKDLVGAVDYVLTFQEVRDIFAAAGIDPAKLEDRERDHSSRAGRIYARTGGVSEAVRSTVEPGSTPTAKFRCAPGRRTACPAAARSLTTCSRGRSTRTSSRGWAAWAAVWAAPSGSSRARRGSATWTPTAATRPAPRRSTTPM